MGPITHISNVEKHVVTLNFSTGREAAVGKSISTEWFMQLKLLVVFSEMKCKKNTLFVLVPF